MAPRTRDRDRPTDGDDTDDSEAPSEDSEEQDDPTPDLSERDRTIEDLAADDGTNVRQQVVSGSRANFELDPKFNPGFTDTEVVNRIGMVLSLNCSYDYNRGVWVGEPIDKSERQAVEQELAEDRATDDLTAPADTDGNTEVDSNGDLKLTDGDTSMDGSIGDPAVRTDDPYYDGLEFTPTETLSQVVVEWSFPGTVPDEVFIRNEPTGEYVYDGPIDYPIQTFNVDLVSGENYGVCVADSQTTIDENLYPVDNFPIDQGELQVDNGLETADADNSYIYNIKGIGSSAPADIGEATTSFDNPCKATSTRSSQHDVCSRSGDVQVDLYNGDPDDPDSTLLAKDIDQREDISDLPDAFSDLQYRIRLTRAPDGSSPKVSRLGHQIIR